MKEKEKRSGEGISLFLGRLFSHISPLLLANVLFVVCSLPVITAGPSLLALCRIASLAVRDENIDTAREFFRTWKKEFKAGLLLNLTLIPLTVLVTLSALRALRVLLLEGWSTQAVLAFVLYLLLTAYSMYLLPLAVCMDAPLSVIAKNALLLCFANGLKTLLGSVFCGAVLLAGLAGYPYSFPLLLLILFALAAYIACFFGWNAAERFVFRPYYEAHPEDPRAEEFLSATENEQV